MSDMTFRLPQLPDLTDPRVVAQIQVQLREATGRDIEADGGLGPRTREGIAVFQRMCGLRPTGTLDELTYDSLNLIVPPGPAARAV